MYLVGRPHPNRDRVIATLRRLRRSDETFVTDVEVYQEILHRYTSIRRLDAVNDAFESLGSLVSAVLTYGMPEIHTARALVGLVDGISARDALHAAVMRQAGISRILSYDQGFDAIPGIERLE